MMLRDALALLGLPEDTAMSEESAYLLELWYWLGTKQKQPASSGQRRAAL